MDFEDSLIRTAEMARIGRAGELPRLLRDGTVQRVRSGAYVAPDAWSAATPEQRQRARIVAVQARARSRLVYVGPSAAVLHGLPLPRGEAERVHVLQREMNGQKSRGDIVRHAWPVPDGDIVEIDGLLVTTLSRTLYDIARLMPEQMSLPAVDAGLRSVSWRGPGRFDLDAAEELRERVLALVEDAGAARGIRRARFVIPFADGRAQLPGESVSRLFMHRLGVDPPELQREVAIAGGRAFPDFAWPRRRRFGEFDGDAKYIDPAFTAGRDVRRTLRDQRAREVAITEATGWLPVRWGWEALRSLSSYAVLLRAHDVLD